MKHLANRGESNHAPQTQNFYDYLTIQMRIWKSTVKIAYYKIQLAYLRFEEQIF